MSLPMVWILELDDLQSSFQSKSFCDNVFSLRKRHDKQKVCAAVPGEVSMQWYFVAPGEVVEETPGSVVQPILSCAPLTRVSGVCQTSSAVVCGGLVGMRYLLLWMHHKGPTSAYKYSLNILCAS